MGFVAEMLAGGAGGGTGGGEGRVGWEGGVEREWGRGERRR